MKAVAMNSRVELVREKFNLSFGTFSPDTAEVVAALINEAIAEERKACAMIAESDLEAYSERMQAEIARRIRARGE